MAAIRPTSRFLSPSSSIFKTLVRFETTSSSSPASSFHQLPPLELSEPSDFLGSWKRPDDPKEAEYKLAMLRREYKKQVKELRRQYIYEMDLQRQEKQRKDEAKREKIRLEKEARKAEKTAAAKTRAAERKVTEDEFREMLLKERADKLAYWKAKQESWERKKSEKIELQRRQSSMWVDEKELDAKILEAVCDVRSL